MEKHTTAAAGASDPEKQEQNILPEAQCPVPHGARRHTVAGAPTNAGWWPDQLNLKILHQHSSLSDPMDKEFNYAEEFKRGLGTGIGILDERLHVALDGS